MNRSITGTLSRTGNTGGPHLPVLCYAVIACLLQGSASAASAEHAAGSFAQLLEWITGDFDNHAQFNAHVKAEGEPSFDHLGLQRRQVTAPALGEHVVYAQINRRADPTDIYRQTFQVFALDEKGNITSKNMRFVEPEKYQDILARPEAFAALTQSDVIPALPESCDPAWRFSGTEFEARISRESCTMISRRDGKARHIQSTEFIGPNLIRNEESGYRGNGERIFGLPAGIYYHYDRVSRTP